MFLFNVQIPSQIAAAFHHRFGIRARIYRAPGRVNLIGEHTDYNQGFVLPAAINLSCWVGIALRGDRKLVIYTENFDKQVEVELDAIGSWSSKGWASYPLGVAWSLGQAGQRLRGGNLYIRGDVPLGAGLSSSAAIEVATAMALLENSGSSMERKELALLCQCAENEFVGARCGIMDQFIACHGQSGHAMFLDCRSLEWRAIPLPKNTALVVCNSMVKHDLAANEYNARRAECEEGVQKLKSVLPAIHSLRDVTIADLEQHRNLLPETIYRRCRHVVTENARVLQASAAFEKGETAAILEFMAASHASLRDDYEVSCRELDILVEVASSQQGVLGARMTGGGFGGCTVNLVEKGFVESFESALKKEYLKRTGLHAEIYCLEAAQGAEAVAVE